MLYEFLGLTVGEHGRLMLLKLTNSHWTVREMPHKTRSCSDALRDCVIGDFVHTHRGRDAQLQFVCSAVDI